MLPELPGTLPLEELDRHIPAIPPVPPGTSRPFWSVMIPTYNRPALLAETLRSVLDQDPGPQQMQIEVVDNGSTAGDAEDVVRELGKGRVGYFRHPENIGAVPNFNFCIERARGRWVQILHDDDRVMPGFYEAYEEIIQRHPEIVMVAGKGIYVDEKDRWERIWGEETNDAELIADFPHRLLERQRLLVSGTVAKRAAYEKAGGWCTFLNLLADWEVWIRVALTGPVAGTARPYVLYRRHSGSDWIQRRLDTVSVREGFVVAASGYERLYGSPLDSRFRRLCRRRWASTAVTRGHECYKNGLPQSRLDFARCAWRLEPSRKTLKFLLKSWVIYLLAKRWSRNPRHGSAARAIDGFESS